MIIKNTWTAAALNRIASAPPISRNLSICLDILRFFSAQLVLWGHLGGFLGGPDFPFGGRWHVQNLGVVIFFVLSGFLIVRTLPRYDSFGAYFVDRFARIYLTLLPGLALIAGMDWLILRAGNSEYAGNSGLLALIGNILMLQDFILLQAVPFLDVISFGSARPLWTLAVEWWLYMFVGWAFLGRSRFWLPFLGMLAIVPIAFATFERGQALTLIWMSGGALAFLPAVHLDRRLLRLGMGLSLLLFALRLLRSGDFYDFQTALYFVVFLGLMLVEARSAQWFDGVSQRTISLVRLLSGASYALYIVHYTLIVLLMALGLDDVIVAVGAILLSNVLAIAIYLLFDRHHRRLADGLRWLLGYSPRAQVF